MASPSPANPSRRSGRRRRRGGLGPELESDGGREWRAGQGRGRARSREGATARRSVAPSCARPPSCTRLLPAAPAAAPSLARGERGWQSAREEALAEPRRPRLGAAVPAGPRVPPRRRWSSSSPSRPRGALRREESAVRQRRSATPLHRAIDARGEEEAEEDGAQRSGR